MAETIEVFPVDKGVITTDIDLFDKATIIKVVGSDIIIETSEKSLIIVYGAVFTSLGNDVVIKDGDGKELSLENLLYSPKVQYKKSVRIESESENDQILLIKDKDQNLVGQETSSEQDEITEFTNVKYSSKQVEEIVDNAIAEAKNSQNESEDQEENLSTAKSLEEAIAEAEAVKSNLAEFTKPPVELVEENLNTDVDSASLNATETETETETLNELTPPILLKPTWDITNNELNSISIANDLLATDSNNNQLKVDLTNTNTFNITGQTAPEISVNITIVNNSNISIFTDTVTSDSNGNWTSVVSGIDNTNNENFQISVTLTGTNDSVATDTKGLRVDTTASNATLALDIPSDTGSSNSDNITNLTTPTITGTAEAGATIVVSKDSVNLGTATANSNGQWSLVIPETVNSNAVLTQGSNVITAQVTDIANNVSSGSQTIILDTTAPSIAPSLTGSAIVGTVVTFLQGSTSIGTATADSNGNFSFTDFTNATLVEGSNTITVRIGVSDSTQTIILDSNLNLAFNLTVASDTGSSNSDNITNLTAPTITGTTEAGATIVVFKGSVNLGTTTADGNGIWSFPIPATVDSNAVLTQGANVITANITDIAGNLYTSTQTITLDNVAPTTAQTSFNLNTASDTGTAGDNLTNLTTPTITGITEAGATVVVLKGSVNLGTTTADGNGVWSFPIPATVNSNAVLIEGANVLTANITDVAGNTASNTQTITLDTLAPATPAATAGLLASFTNDAVSTITGTADAGTVIQFNLVDAQNITTIVGTTLVTSGGNWSFGFDTNTSSGIALGSYTLNITSIDSAGNESGALAQNIVITQAITLPVIGLDPASDTSPTIIPTVSELTTDRITNDNTPTYTGTAEAGTSVRLFRSGESNHFAQITVVGNNNGIGTWSYTDTGLQANGSTITLSEGTQTISALTVSIVNSAEVLSGRVDLVYTIDRTAPATVTIDNNNITATLESSTIAITGTGVVDNYIYLTVTQNGANIFTSGNQVLRVQSDGTWSVNIDPANVPTPGSNYVINVSQLDPAGNQSASVTRGLTVQQTAIEVTSQGQDTTPEFQLTLFDDSTVSATVTIGSTTTSILSSTAVDVSTLTNNHFNFSAPSALAEGSYTLSVTVGSQTLTETFVIDTTPPASLTVGLADSSEGIANVATDTTPEFTGVTEAGATVVLTIDGQSVTTTADGSGNWTVTLPTALANNAAYTAIATATDVYGNSTTTNYNFNLNFVDLVELLTSNISLVTNNASFPTITNDTTPSFSGSGADVGTVVHVSLNGTIVGTSGTVGSDGSWTVTLNEQNIDNSGTVERTFQFFTQDSNGNQANTVDFSITIDILAPNQTTITSVVENNDTFTIVGTASDSTGGSGVGNVAISYSENGGGNVIYGNVSVDNSGNWSLTGVSLNSGSTYSFTAVAQDRAGNSGPASDPASAPNPKSNEDSSSANALNVKLTGDTDASDSVNTVTSSAPTLTGTGTAGDTIKIANGLNSLTTTVANDGTWSAQVQSIVNENVATTLTIIDATNPSFASASFSLTYDDPAT